MSNDQMDESTSPSRRSVVKGAAWAVPAVVVAGAAPTVAASPACVGVTFGANSCKWPGGGQNAWGYRLEVCFTNDCATDVTVVIRTVRGNTGNAPVTTYNLTLVVPANGQACTEPPLIHCSDNSANFLLVTYSVDGGPDQEAPRLNAPPQDCTGPSACA